MGVIGGSAEYTGAPYYAGAAALKSGADIVHVFCPEEASIPMKSYSPELIVHQCLHEAEKTSKWISNACSSLVIGPGLGREEETTGRYIQEIFRNVFDNSKNFTEEANKESLSHEKSTSS